MRKFNITAEEVAERNTRMKQIDKERNEIWALLAAGVPSKSELLGFDIEAEKVKLKIRAEKDRENRVRTA